jgi:hypothetical protein
VAVAPAQAAPALATVTAKAGGAQTAAAAAPAQAAPPPDESILARLRRLFPPTGEPMVEAKRLDQPSVGIVLPTASSGAPAVSDPAKKTPPPTKP